MSLSWTCAPAAVAVDWVPPLGPRGQRPLEPAARRSLRPPCLGDPHRVPPAPHRPGTTRPHRSWPGTVPFPPDGGAFACGRARRPARSLPLPVRRPARSLPLPVRRPARSLPLPVRRPARSLPLPPRARRRFAFAEPWASVRRPLPYPSFPPDWPRPGHPRSRTPPRAALLRSQRPDRLLSSTGTFLYRRDVAAFASARLPFPLPSHPATRPASPESWPPSPRWPGRLVRSMAHPFPRRAGDRDGERGGEMSSTSGALAPMSFGPCAVVVSSPPLGAGTRDHSHGHTFPPSRPLERRSRPPHPR
jgi:hypothetical protein